MPRMKPWAATAITSLVLGCSGSSTQSGNGGTASAAGGSRSIGGAGANVGGAQLGGTQPAGGSAAQVSGTTTSSGGIAPNTGGVTSSTGGASVGVGGATTGNGGTVNSTGGTATSTGSTSKSAGGTQANTGGKSASTGGQPSAGGTPSSSGGAATSSGGAIASTGGTSTTSTSTRAVPVGHCGAKQGLYFPQASWIYTDITSAPTRANSAAMTAWLETNGGWGNGNHFQIDTSFAILDADASTPRVAGYANDPMDYSGDCDPNVMMPVPAGGHVEGYPDYICPGRTAGSPNDDCHMLVADFSSNSLFEAYQATYSGGNFYSTCTINWNMTKDVWGTPPASGAALPPVAQRNWGVGRECTGPDAAGFPIAPLLFTVGDVLSGKVEHAIRFALPNARMQSAAVSGDKEPVYVWPATHAGGPEAYDANAPIYGTRWRLKANFDPTSRGLDPNNAVVKAVVYGLQHYGMLLADGGEIALMAEDDGNCSATWDNLWGDPGSHALYGILPSDFDILDTGGTDAGWNCVRNAR